MRQSWRSNDIQVKAIFRDVEDIGQSQGEIRIASFLGTRRPKGLSIDRRPRPGLGGPWRFEPMLAACVKTVWNAQEDVEAVPRYAVIGDFRPRVGYTGASHHVGS